MRLFAALLASLLGISAAAAVAAPSTSSKAAFTTILERYAAHDYAGATDGIAAIDQLSGVPASQVPNTSSINWQEAARDWIRKAPSASDAYRRKMVAATVALEIVHGHPEVAPIARIPYFAWACVRVRDHPSNGVSEHLWYLVSVAVLQEAGGIALRSARPEDMIVRVVRDETGRAETLAGHLTHAQTAFPEETRFKLADVLARTPAFSSGPSMNLMDGNEIPPSNPPTRKDIAQLVAERLALLPAIEKDLESLTQIEPVRADAELNLGYLLARERRWDEATTHLRRVPDETREPILVCISHYLRGWVLERTDQRDGAIAEYRSALELSPYARSISVMLADQLGQAGRQAEAYDILDAGLKATLAAADPRFARPAAVAAGARPPIGRFIDRRSDPWELFRRGDAWRIPAWLAQLREALE